MSLLRLHSISFWMLAVAYAMPLKDPFALRRITVLGRISPGMLAKVGPCELHDSAQNFDQALAGPVFVSQPTTRRAKRRASICR
jgi:hypothetical protein